MTRTERTYYLVYGLYNFSWSFIGPMYALFLISRGLDLFEVSVVPAVYWIVSFLFEVPTGAFADVAGRRTSFLLSCFVRMVAFGLYAFAHSFSDFIVAELFDALGSTLANGALDAWAVDGMRGEGEGRPAARFFARAQMIARIAIICGGLSGGYLAQHDMTWPWVAAASSFALTGAIAALRMSEVRSVPHSATAPRRFLVQTIRDGMSTVRNTPVVLLLCLLTWGLAFAVMPAQMYWQPRMRLLSGEGLWLMGWIWALLNLFSLIGSAVLPRLLGRYRREILLSSVTLWRGLMLGVAAAASSFMPALAGLLLLELGFGVSEPIFQAWMNEHIGAEQRATVLSVRAMCFTLGSGTGLLCLGRIARDVGIPAAWVTSAVILLLIAPVFLILARRVEQARIRALLPEASIGAKVIP